MQIQVKSPNVLVRPSTAKVNAQGHLEIGGCDSTELAAKFGTPLWVMDEQTIRDCIQAYKTGLSVYPNTLVLYAGKAFLTLALCHLLDSLGLGLDVVSEGELYTAEVSGFPSNRIYLHGNNKTEAEISNAISLGARIVVDNVAELDVIGALAARLNKSAKLHFRLIPGIEPDTHDHIKTGHYDSKFGIPLEELSEAIKILRTMGNAKLVGIHAHIGSQSHDIEPYLQNVTVLAEAAASIKSEFGIELEEIDVGGGLGIAYVEQDRPMAIYEWAHAVATRALSEFTRLGLGTPKLLVEPGRSIVGTAGVTLYRAGAMKELPSGKVYLPVDGGMADNPRPITYQAKYTACIANRMSDNAPEKPLTLVGRYCESGDIIVKDANLAAKAGDLVAIFGTGAYNYSMASNYNRSPRPACILVAHGSAEVIVERESNEDLIRKDRVPERLLRRPHE
ncbi:MAG: diaminopimelate decarboxylase [Candidatus Obscuribacterales bacterium]|nr:diaminopimelate decarboxylase [Candidatus Obscuribacterales bacterium]